MDTPFICTADHPWDEEKSPHRFVRHPDAEEVGHQRDGYPGGDLQDYKCPHCGVRWTVELPQ